MLDLNLPDMAGLDVLRQIRVARVDTPVLILTGDLDTDTKLRGFGGGADDYLTKPFHREELVRRAFTPLSAAARVMRNRSFAPGS